MRRIILRTVLILFLLAPSSPLGAQEYIIKFATVAPEGSTWMNVMKEYDQAVRAESHGRIGFKIYPGGVQGDEKDVLQKIRLGQLQCAGVTGNGLTTIAPAARILDAPFLFRNYDEVDRVYATFDAEFERAFEENGYVNLGWAEVGFVYVFTNTRVEGPADMKNVRMWIWEGDPIAEAAIAALNVHDVVPLAITDVFTSLQTHLIDGVYASPLAMIALQWFSRTKYMLDVPLADAAGAVVISKKKFDQLPADLQEILRRNGKIYLGKLTRLSREENRKSLDALKKNGVIIVEPKNSKDLAEYEQLGKQARQTLAGKLFTADLLNRVEQEIARLRPGSGAGRK
ncbi:MAG TPA: TRAP transporter substrate-binding protein DctP [Bacteroidota bacterium]|nr:TRAP transporter substrate-binding protein DctP [Bacteroidota bacterium]